MAKASVQHGNSWGTGKRKHAIARILLSPGGGKLTVNGREFLDYFPRETLRMLIHQPFEVIQKTNQFDVIVKVSGGGLSAQAQAIRHGISRALISGDPNCRPSLKKAGFLTRDARKKERKKPGQPGPRKKFQYSKR